MPEPTSSIKTRVGEFFRSRLDTATGPSLKFFLNNADEDTPPPYGVVVVSKMEEVYPESRRFKTDIRIRLISSIDRSTSDEHDVLLRAVLDGLDNIPRKFTAADLKIYGWVIISDEPIIKEESQSYTDEIAILCGCGG
jgi:hypothetical protein